MPPSCNRRPVGKAPPSGCWGRCPSVGDQGGPAETPPAPCLRRWTECCCRCRRGATARRPQRAVAAPNHCPDAPWRWDRSGGDIGWTSSRAGAGSSPGQGWPGPRWPGQRPSKQRPPVQRQPWLSRPGHQAGSGANGGLASRGWEGAQRGGPPCRLAPVFDLEEPVGGSRAGRRFQLKAGLRCRRCRPPVSKGSQIRNCERQSPTQQSEITVREVSPLRARARSNAPPGAWPGPPAATPRGRWTPATG